MVPPPLRARTTRACSALERNAFAIGFRRVNLRCFLFIAAPFASRGQTIAGSSVQADAARPSPRLRKSPVVLARSLASQEYIDLQAVVAS